MTFGVVFKFPPTALSLIGRLLGRSAGKGAALCFLRAVLGFASPPAGRDELS
jgi:hypothetical protein